MIPTLVITNCTNRKRAKGQSRINFGDIAAGCLSGVAAKWAGMVRAWPTVESARDLYCGRSFSEALSAERETGGNLLIVSAGLGLVKADAKIPNYSATISSGPDSILAKIPGSTSSDWWEALTEISPFSSDLRPAIGQSVWVSLSGPYLRMIEPTLMRLVRSGFDEIRIFGKPHDLHHSLDPFVLPYDDRLNDPTGLPGTQGDFAQRALSHFARNRSGRDAASLDEDVDFVREALAPLTAPKKPSRKPASDREIVQTITSEAVAVGWGSSAMLRHLRDQVGIACEQGRFRDLFRLARQQAGQL